MEEEREREMGRERHFDTLTFYCLQLTSPEDTGNMINFPPRTATCENHVVLSKGISSMDNKDESSASAKCSALPAEIFTFNPSHITQRERQTETETDRDRDKRDRERIRKRRGGGTSKRERNTKTRTIYYVLVTARWNEANEESVI